MLARLRPHDGADGFSLVEILVAISLLSVVMMLATNAIIRALNQSSNLTQQSEAQNRNNTGMEQLTRMLRDAVLPSGGTSTTSSVITVASGTQVQFTTRLDSTSNATASPSSWSTPTVQVSAQLSGTQLKWGTGAQSATCSGVCTYAAPTVNKTLVYGVQNANGTSVCPSNTGDGAVFHYWYVDPTGNLAAWSSTSNTLSQISVVQIDLWTQTQTGPSTPKCVNLTDYVKLRNWS